MIALHISLFTSAHLTRFISCDSRLKSVCCERLESPLNAARLAATCRDLFRIFALNTWVTNCLFIFFAFTLNRCQRGIMLDPCLPQHHLIWKSNLASQVNLLWNMNTWEACRQCFPENRIPLESNAPCPLLLCIVWIRKPSVDVRAKDRNPSHPFQPYQLHSSSIPPYHMTLSAILSHSFPHGRTL